MYCNCCNVTLNRVRATIAAGGKSTNIAFFECLYVALGTENAMLMRRIVEEVRLIKKERKNGVVHRLFRRKLFPPSSGSFLEGQW